MLAHHVHQAQAGQVDEQRDGDHNGPLCCCHGTILVVGIEHTTQDDQQHRYPRRPGQQQYLDAYGDADVHNTLAQAGQQLLSCARYGRRDGEASSLEGQGYRRRSWLFLLLVWRHVAVCVARGLPRRRSCCLDTRKT